MLQKTRPRCQSRGSALQLLALFSCQAQMKQSSCWDSPFSEALLCNSNRLHSQCPAQILRCLVDCTSWQSGLGMSWALEKSLTRPFFFCFFKKSGKNKATDLAVSQLQGSTIAIISAPVLGPQMWAGPGPSSSSESPKQWKSDGSVKIYNSVNARLLLMKSKKKQIIESAAI